MSRRIHKLREDSGLSPQDSISLLKRESALKKDIASPGDYSISGSSSLKKPAREQAHENIDKLKDIDEDTKPE
jgi:hypothetical protein